MTRSKTEYLCKARDYIERGWTQGSSARDVYGESVLANSPRAVTWCAIGAINAAMPGASIERREVLRNELRDALAVGRTVGVTPVSAYNDQFATKKADILALFDRAIEMQGGRE